uniref:Uncharacterized protein n=1 Tax=Populus trichocarpa TaxID=3694 RepID=A0A2K2AC52_POPTR
MSTSPSIVSIVIPFIFLKPTLLFTFSQPFLNLFKYFFPAKRFLLNISNLKLNLLKYTGRVHVSRFYGFNSIFFY